MAKIMLAINGAEDTTEEQEELIEDLVRLFERCINLVLVKNATYGNAWRQQGYQGNLARILSKTARLKEMLWGEHEKPGLHESVEDTARDLINLTAFFLLNRQVENKWGR